MKKNQNIIIIILLILVTFLGLSTFYYLNLYKKLNKENSELKIKISNTDNQTENTEQKNEVKNGYSITEEQAKEIMENYRKEIISKYVNDYRFVQIRKEKVDFQSKCIIGENLYDIDFNTPYDNRILDINNSEIEAYAIYYDSEDKENVMTGYVDINTGKILGVYQKGR